MQAPDAAPSQQQMRTISPIGPSIATARSYPMSDRRRSTWHIVGSDDTTRRRWMLRRSWLPFPSTLTAMPFLCYCLNNIFEIASAMFRYAHFTPVGSESTPDMIERWLDDVRALARQHV
jgi:hypothetical protein